MSDENISANGNLPEKVNVNTAPEEELAQVPGVGPAMAKRIIAARPFSALSDLQRVSGIGPFTIERMKPFVILDNELAELEAEGERVFETAMLVDEAVVEVEDEELSDMPAAEEDMEVVEAVAVEDMADEADEEIDEAAAEPEKEPEADWVAKVLSDQPKAPPEPVLPKSPPPAVTKPEITRGQVVWIALGSSLLAFLLAIALSLGVLAALNDGQLQFASPGQIIDLNRQISTLGDQARTLEGDIGSLRTRIDNLELLGDRVDVVEQTTADIAADLATTADQVTELGNQTEAIAGEVEAVAGEVDTLQAENERFDTFFTGLQDLLNQVFAPGE